MTLIQDRFDTYDGLIGIPIKSCAKTKSSSASDGVALRSVHYQIDRSSSMRLICRCCN